MPNLNLSNRPVRTRMPGGVAGERSLMIAPYADCAAQKCLTGALLLASWPMPLKGCGYPARLVAIHQSGQAGFATTP